MPVPIDDQWHPVPDYEGYYEVNADAEVRRVKPVGPTYQGRILKHRLSHNGYHRVQFCKGGKKKVVGVHRLVAVVFVGPQPTPDHQINHRDGNKDNNRPENLEWVTCLENHRHASMAGLKSHGSAHWRSKLDEDQAREIRLLKGKEGHKVTARRFGVDKSLVGLIQRGRIWKHV